jgi:hypothetical protein
MCAMYDEANTRKLKLQAKGQSPFTWMQRPLYLISLHIQWTSTTQAASLRALSFESLTIYLFGTYRTYCVELLYEMKFPGSSMPQPEVDISLISIVIVVFNAG